MYHQRKMSNSCKMCMLLATTARESFNTRGGAADFPGTLSSKAKKAMFTPVNTKKGILKFPFLYLAISKLVESC